MIDFHSHILPKIDDGSSSINETLIMVKNMVEQGTKLIVATPHFYATRHTPKRFCEKRLISALAFKKYLMSINEEIGAHIALGAELTYFDNVSRLDELQEFCIEGTNTLLLELPFAKITDKIYEEVAEIRARGIIPLIAHCEKYLPYQNNFDNLVDSGAYIQCNADFFINKFACRTALKLLKKNLIHVLGSDAHNLDSRPPLLGSAVSRIKKKLPQQCLDNIKQNQKMLIKGVKGLKI